MPASISDLVGFAKSSSDLESRPMRIRYNESQTIQSGQYYRMTFPKVSNDLLDLRSIKMRFQMNIESGDPDTCVDASDIRCIFNRIRVLSGSQVLCDISEASLLYQLEANIETSSVSNQYERYLCGRESLTKRQAYPATREYITSIAPIGSLLNCEALLPLSRLSDLHVEFWLETDSRILLSTSDATYHISGVEILCDYI